MLWDYDNTERSHSLMAGTRFNPTEKLHILAGTRYTDLTTKSVVDYHYTSGAVDNDPDSVTRRKHHRFIPYFGITYDITPHHSIYASYTSIFKPNSYKDRHERYLPPVLGNNYEIGWKKTHGAHAWKAALFHMYIKDNITATLNKARTEYKYTNEDFRNTGFELSDEIQGKHGFSYNWGVTWQNPETRSTEKEVGWERTFGKVQLTGGVTYKKGKWASTLTGSYLAGRVQSPSNAPAYRSKPYLLTSWNTSYAPDEHSEFSLRIDNVLNRDDVTTHTGSDYYVSPTSFLLRYGYKF